MVCFIITILKKCFNENNPERKKKMPDILQVGPIALNSNMLIYIFSLILGLFMMRLRLWRTDYAPKTVFDLMLSNVLIVVLFWKLGTILFVPSLIWTKPLQILMMTGTWKEVLLGVLIACIYTFFKLKKMEMSFLVLLDLIPYGILAAVICRSLFSWQYGSPTNLPWGISLTEPEYQYHPINIYLLLLSAPLILWLWRGTLKLGKGKIIQEFLMYYGIGLWVISLFKVRSEGMFILSGEQISYTVMVVLGIGIQYIIKAASVEVDSR
jgi:prolipoprotein diacylglyceryltransferase